MLAGPCAHREEAACSALAFPLSDCSDRAPALRMRRSTRVAGWTWRVGEGRSSELWPRLRTREFHVKRCPSLMNLGRANTYRSSYRATRLLSPRGPQIWRVAQHRLAVSSNKRRSFRWAPAERRCHTDVALALILSDQANRLLLRANDTSQLTGESERPVAEPCCAAGMGRLAVRYGDRCNELRGDLSRVRVMRRPGFLEPPLQDKRAVLQRNPATKRWPSQEAAQARMPARS